MEQPDQFQQTQQFQPSVEPQSAVQTPMSQVPEGQTPTTPSTQNVDRKSPRKILFVIIIIAVILIGAGAVGYSYLNRIPASEEELLPSSNVTTTEAPHYVGSQTITFLDVTGGNSSGTVSRNITLGRATHVFTANLPELIEGQFYQAWMIKESEPPAPVGILNKNTEGAYVLETDYQFDEKNAYFSTFETIHNTLAISLESADDQIMETKILEGTFTQ